MALLEKNACTDGKVGSIIYIEIGLKGSVIITIIHIQIGRVVLLMGAEGD